MIFAFKNLANCIDIDGTDLEVWAHRVAANRIQKKHEALMLKVGGTGVRLDGMTGGAIKDEARAVLREYEAGTLLKVERTCPACGSEVDVSNPAVGLFPTEHAAEQVTE